MEPGAGVWIGSELDQMAGMRALARMRHVCAWCLTALVIGLILIASRVASEAIASGASDRRTSPDSSVGGSKRLIVEIEPHSDSASRVQPQQHSDVAVLQKSDPNTIDPNGLSLPTTFEYDADGTIIAEYRGDSRLTPQSPLPIYHFNYDRQDRVRPADPNSVSEDDPSPIPVAPPEPKKNVQLASYRAQCFQLVA